MDKIEFHNCLFTADTTVITLFLADIIKKKLGRKLPMSPVEAKYQNKALIFHLIYIYVSKTQARFLPTASRRFPRYCWQCE